MFDKKLSVSLLVLLFAIVPIYGQDAPSLGDMARHLRADKDKTASPATISPKPNSAAAASANVWQTKAQNWVMADPQPEASGQYEPYATREEFNLHFLNRYEEGIRTLFEQEKFESLELITDTARSTKARLPGGFWTIHIIYGALMAPAAGTYASSANDWTTHLARLQRWVMQRPDSITARVALGTAQLQYAWSARGGGYADSVTEDGWKLLQQRAEVAAKTLMDAFSLQAKCPEWFLTMQMTARALGQSREVQTAIFEKAIAFEPDYHYFYRAQAELLMPKWEGEEGEMAAFAQQAADRIGGQKGDMIYYEIATFVNCGCDNDRKLYGMSWPRIKRGYTALEEQYEESIANLNAMAYMAGMSGDMSYADEMFKRIGEGWDKKVWHKRENFDMVRQRAQVSELPKMIEAAMKAADYNRQTPVGRKFDEQMAKTFASNYSATVTDCLKKSGDSFMVPFDMALLVGQNGAVEQVLTSTMSHTISCIMAKVGSGLFPPPPQPDYWVKISMQARR